MLSITTHRPRNVDSKRAAAILYGDLGTSKAYVIGLAFAVAGYASFWLIALVSILTVLIGINYMVICKYYPNGGGVYASVRKRSKIISLIGAFFLIADYLVTASLSALSAFHYLRVSDPILFASLAIVLIGVLNYFGPRHSGSVALVIGLAAVGVLTVLAAFSIPYLPIAWSHIQPLKGTTWGIWKNFVGVIVALSGIEAIANATGVMKLNKGTTIEFPLVTKTSSKAIGIVILEVAVYTSLFAFAAAAIGNFHVANDNVTVPGYPDVRDSMLHYLAKVFVGNILGEGVGTAFSWILSTVIGVLLLSAVNTAVNGLIALQYLMGSDKELPEYFTKVNRFGVPFFALLSAIVIPIVLVILVKNVAGLATLYAIGFVGAIATNLGSTSTDKSLDLKWRERILMFFSFLIMFLVEITLFITKPSARMYALAVIAVGLILRGLSLERKEKQEVAKEVSLEKKKEVAPAYSILCPVRRVGPALKAAIKKSNTTNCPLHLLFLREQVVISDSDLRKSFENDPQAMKVMEYARQKGKKELVHFYYCLSDSPVDIIAAYAIRFEVNEIFIDKPTRARFVQILHGGETLKRLRRLVPKTMALSVIS